MKLRFLPYIPVLLNLSQSFKSAAVSAPRTDELCFHQLAYNNYLSSHMAAFSSVFIKLIIKNGQRKELF